MAERVHLDEEIFLDLVGSLLVGLALGAGFYQSVQVKSQVTNLVTQVLTGLGPATAAVLCDARPTCQTARLSCAIYIGLGAIAYEQRSCARKAIARLPLV